MRRSLEGVGAEATSILENLFPAAAVAALMRGDSVAPRSYPRAVVLVLDLVDFTRMTAALPGGPRELMGLMNVIFCRLDLLVEAAGLWKAETVGDAYIVVATGEWEPEAPIVGRAIIAQAATCNCYASGGVTGRKNDNDIREQRDCQRDQCCSSSSVPITEIDVVVRRRIRLQFEAVFELLGGFFRKNFL